MHRIGRFPHTILTACDQTCSGCRWSGRETWKFRRVEACQIPERVFVPYVWYVLGGVLAVRVMEEFSVRHVISLHAPASSEFVLGS